MRTLLKWKKVVFITLVCLIMTSCGKEEPSVNNSMYSLFDMQHFSKKWMVAHIQENGRVVYSFEYDSINRPTEAYIYGQNYLYNYEGNTCTYTSYGDKYKGYFDGNKLIKAEWDKYTITNITYDGNHLIMGSNGGRLTWDSHGNITHYNDGRINFTYTKILNNANVDFNMVLSSLLSKCWDDDGSKYFTIFGWTGARTSNLLSHLDREVGNNSDFSYTLDGLGRPVEIIEDNQGDTYKYTINYVEN